MLAGANVLALEGDAGWELIQYRSAEFLGDDRWRLSGLLRGQQGTDSLEAGEGAIVVFLNEAPAVVDWSADERGLPLIWRAGPEGLPGGRGVSEITWTATGAGERPWSPAHLRGQAVSGGDLQLSWSPRSRRDGDRWDEDVTASSPLRFRLRILRGEEVVRVAETEIASFVYAADMSAGDFPAGAAGVGRIAVAQWEAGYGWGAEAVLAL